MEDISSETKLTPSYLETLSVAFLHKLAVNQRPKQMPCLFTMDKHFHSLFCFHTVKVCISSPVSVILDSAFIFWVNRENDLSALGETVQHIYRDNIKRCDRGESVISILFLSSSPESTPTFTKLKENLPADSVDYIFI